MNLRKCILLRSLSFEGLNQQVNKILFWKNSKINGFRADRIRAWAFSSSNQEHVKQLVMMGIELITLSDGRLHLSHKSVNVSEISLNSK